MTILITQITVRTLIHCTLHWVSFTFGQSDKLLKHLFRWNIQTRAKGSNTTYKVSFVWILITNYVTYISLSLPNRTNSLLLYRTELKFIFFQNFTGQVWSGVIAYGQHNNTRSIDIHVVIFRYIFKSIIYLKKTHKVWHQRMTSRNPSESIALQLKLRVTPQRMFIH